MRIELPKEAGLPILALIVALVAGGVWYNHATAPEREALIHRRLQQSGFEDAELKPAWLFSCPRRTIAYRWTAANGRGRACTTQGTVYVFIDERR